MAWAAELKRRNWYCINDVFMPQIFSRQLRAEWYASLSEEDRQRLAARKKKEQEDRELQNTLCEIEMVAALCSSITNKYKV